MSGSSALKFGLGGASALGGIAASAFGAPELGVPLILGGLGEAAGNALGGTGGALSGGLSGLGAGLGLGAKGFGMGAPSAVTGDPGTASYPGPNATASDFTSAATGSSGTSGMGYTSPQGLSNLGLAGLQTANPLIQQAQAQQAAAPAQAQAAAAANARPRPQTQIQPVGQPGPGTQANVSPMAAYQQFMRTVA